MIIVFYAGYQKTPLHPNLLKTTGLGGTEQCIVHLADALSHEHTVYVTGGVKNINHRKVKYRCETQLKKELGDTYVDCVIAASYINYFLELDFLNFKNSMFWVHNTDFYSWYRGNELPNLGRDYLLDQRLKHIVCLTEWHKETFISQFPEIESKVVVIGNGISKKSFNKNIKKIQNSFIYTSHSERGLNQILSEWSSIKTNLPNASLHISTPEYGLGYLEENFLDIIKNSADVHYHGSLSQRGLYKLMAKCQYWYYPTEYEETFCITALEMLGHQVLPIAKESAGLTETLRGFNIKKLDNLDLEISWKDASDYVENCDWTMKKTHWISYIYNMDNDNSTLEQPDIEIDMLEDLENAIPPPEHLPDEFLHEASESENLDLEINLPDSDINNTEFEINEEILNVDCVYIISLEHTEENLEKWKSDIRANIPWYKGPILGKKAVNGANVTNSWLEENDYKLYEDWQLPDSDVDWWNRPLDPGAIGCAISHHQVWEHASKSNYKNIIVLEDDFKINSTIEEHKLAIVPFDYDLFYLGRNSLPSWGDEISVGSHGIVKPAPSYNTHAYMLSSKGIESLLNQQFNKYIMPLDEFFICCYARHIRQDLNFVYQDLVAYGISDDLISQTRKSSASGPRTDISFRKHQDLYSYWDDSDTWKKKFVAYATRTKEWELIIDEPFDNCFSMPLFTQEFCEKIREEAEHSNAWTTDRHEHYPTTDMLLGAIGMDRIYYEVLKEYVMPAAIHLYHLTSTGWDCMTTEDFLAKYIPSAQGHLSLHHDASDITALVTLSNFDEYEGGGTYFSHQKKLVKEKQGYVSIHPGNITHRHGARATTKGTRYILVSFMSQNNNT